MILSEIGPDFEIWASPSNSLAPARHSVGATNDHPASRGQVVKMATGMNFWNGSRWAGSEAGFHPNVTGDAFVADRVQHRTRLTAELNTMGAVTVTLPDGSGELHSTPVAIGLYDPATGRAAILASITNSTAMLINSNRVVFPDAFRENGICASILYTIKNGSFAQDVVITGHFDPNDYGFPAESQIQVFTEVYDDVQPVQIDRIIPDQHAVTARRPDRVDHVLDFGKFVLGAGRAHAMLAGVIGTNLDSPVTKEFKSIDGRRFIVESLESLRYWAFYRRCRYAIKRPN
jgi:hypothetical protein